MFCRTPEALFVRRRPSKVALSYARGAICTTETFKSCSVVRQRPLLYDGDQSDKQIKFESYACSDESYPNDAIICFRKPIHTIWPPKALQKGVPCTTPFSNRAGTRRDRLYALHKGSAWTGFRLRNLPAGPGIRPGMERSGAAATRSSERTAVRACLRSKSCGSKEPRGPGIRPGMDRCRHRSIHPKKMTRTPERAERSSLKFWGEMWGSNPRHPEPQSGALPTELISPCWECKGTKKTQSCNTFV